MTRDPYIPEPTHRKLRIYALDPSLAAQHETASIGELTIEVPWEPLDPGPVGEYVEVIDADPASRCFYAPVDLNDPRLLALDGLPPSETHPQFHQQMAYAVAMATIAHFEQALGRVALWSAHRENDADGHFVAEHYVQRLRIYPHALRDRNAYYSPKKKALMFGYFPAEATNALNPQGSTVFTVLSHDIVAHETTHALLDGVHPRFNEPVNVDVLAFHEAFADIVALFQHFSYPGVLRHQIARTRGNLGEENLLAQLAQQFGRAAGRGEALRDALGGRDAQGRWTPRTPDLHALDGVTEPHQRGAILVAAVFGAFLMVYRARTLDLYRIASEGTGVLRPGEIHPDLANRLADEAARCAQYTLQMCIRAIDHCPPVGITFGDYLRAIVTADHDVNPADAHGFRIAMIQSFGQWGIHPEGLPSLSPDALLWPDGARALEDEGIVLPEGMMHALFTDEYRVGGDTLRRDGASEGMRAFKPWNLDSDRRAVWQGVDDNAAVLWTWLTGAGRTLLPALGLTLDEAAPKSVFRSKANGLPTLEVHSVRTALRRSPRGATVPVLVVEILQRRRGWFDRKRQQAIDAGAQMEKEDFRFRAGCTVLIDPSTRELRRVIRTRGRIDDDEALERVRAYLAGGSGTPHDAFWLGRAAMDADEPFALLHRHEEH